MKLNRRAFISLVVGGAAGIHFTPLPWKLMDDSSIWTQNWPWVPKSSRYPGVSYAGAVCNLCPGGCGLRVRMVNEKNTVKVEGDPAAPVNMGKTCPVGAAGAQYQYHTARFQTPLKTFGARGSGAYLKIDWADAFKELGGKLKELREKGLAHSVVWISGRRPGPAQDAARRFMAAYGSPNFVEMPSLEISRAVAEKAQFGHANQVGYDLGKASFVLSFGCALIEGWGSPVRSIQAYSSWKTKGGVKLVQVDTRASLTASKADDFVAAAPGTEGALALALAHVIIRDGLFKKDWVEAHAFGFEEFKNLVIREYAPKAVSELTGVPAEKIEALAKEFAKAKAPLALGGRGAGAAPTPVYELMAVMALNALVGNINQPGGVIVRRSLPLTPLAEAPVDDKAKTTLAMPRLDGALSAKYPLTPSILENLTDAILGGGPYPVNVVILDQANPAFFGANPSAFVAALAKAPLVVTFNSLADDSGMLADLALPETSNFDGPVEVTTPPSVPFPVFGAAGALTDTGFDAKPIGDILAGLAKVVGGSAAQALPFKNHAEMVQKAAEGLFSSGRGRVAKGNLAADVFGQKDEPQKFKDVKEFQKALAAGRFWYDPGFTFGVLENTFLTPSTKFEFFSQTLQAALAGFVGEKGPEAAMVELGLKAKADQLCLPHYEPIAPKPSDALPLLMMPVEQLKMVTNARGNAPYLTKLLEDITLAGNELVVEIHPETAEKAHLYEGDLARLDTLKGAAHVRVHLFEGARPGVIYAPLGLGHRGFGYYLRGKGMNPMEFVDRTPDPLSGQALWWGTKANLTKV